MKKYDCSKVVDYTHEQKRMCKTHKTCWECPLLKRCAYPNQESVDIVQKWSDEHQCKTRQDKVLEVFPNAELKDGILNICPCKINETILKKMNCSGISCWDCKRNYWKYTIEEVEE